MGPIYTSQLSLEDVFPNDIDTPLYQVGSVLYVPYNDVTRVVVKSIKHDGKNYIYSCVSDDTNKFSFDYLESELYPVKKMENARKAWQKLEVLFKCVKSTEMYVNDSASFSILYYKPQKRGNIVSRIHSYTIAIIDGKYLYEAGTGILANMKKVPNIEEAFANKIKKINSIQDAIIMGTEIPKKLPNMYYDEIDSAYKEWNLFFQNNKIDKCRNYAA